jgi:RHS repeat-associated protein
VRATTDAAGRPTQTRRTDEYGVPTEASGGSGQPFGYTGEQRDATGLVYLRARMYDPASGRFMQRDLFPGARIVPSSLHRYIYVYNNPPNGTDPSGEIPLPVITAAVGAVAGAATNFAVQVVANGGDVSKVDGRAVIAAGAVGAVAGALAPFTAVTWTGAALSGAAANVAQYGLTNYMTGQEGNPEGIVVAAATGLIGGLLGGKVSRTNTLLDPRSPWLDRATVIRAREQLDYYATVTRGNIARNVLGGITGNLPIDVGATGLPLRQKHY